MTAAHPVGGKSDRWGQGMSGETPESGEGPAPTDPTTVQASPSGTDDAAPHASGHMHAHHAAIQFRFLEKLKHRNIIRVGILYLVACWLILDPVHVVFHMLEVPAWANRLVVILMAIGFPAVLLFAWVYEITPEGLRPTVEVEPHRSIRKLTGQRLDRAIMLLLVLGIAYLLLDKFWLSKHVATAQLVNVVAPVAPAATPAATAISEKSVAVLPFTDMSEKHDQEYFGDGMAEEIIDLLVKVPDLHVPARTSSFYFKGKSEDIPTIAKRLMVAHVLEGSVRRSGNHLRITAQLVRADNGYHMWSETYDRDLQDVFKVQDDIANAVVQALQITLMGGPLTRQKGGTQNLEAYQLYLRATSAELQNTQMSLEAERTYLEQAVGLDPTFGLAWSRMASNAMLETEHAILSPPEGFERARQLAQRALQLSPDLSEPHSVLSYVHRIYDWDWVAAATESRRALELDPTNIQGFVIAGIIAYTLGHWDDAERHLRMALAHDPLNTYVLLNLGVTLYGAGRYADADSMYRRLLDVAPGFSWTHMYLGKTLLAEGKPDAALAIVQQDTDEEDRMEILPIVLQAAGHKAEADEALKSLIDKFANVSAYYVAMTYAYRGDPDLALQWLERAYKQKDPSLVEIVGEPLFSNITHDPRYKAFLRKMNLPE